MLHRFRLLSGALIALVAAAAFAATAGSASAADSSEWIPVADEGETFWVGIANKVRYGTENRFTEGVMGGGDHEVSCSNSVFGDPAVGIRKQCFMRNPDTDPEMWDLYARDAPLMKLPTHGPMTVYYGTPNPSHPLTPAPVNSGFVCHSEWFRAVIDPYGFWPTADGVHGSPWHGCWYDRNHPE